MKSIKQIAIIALGVLLGEIFFTFTKFMLVSVFGIYALSFIN